MATKTKPKKKSGQPLLRVKEFKEFRAQSLDQNIGYFDGVPIPDNLVDMIDAYQLHPVVYSAVNVIATHFASVDYKIFFRGEEKKEDLKHPFNKILNRPNPYMTGYDLRESLAISKEMCGNAYWALERDAQGVPIEAWPLPPHLVRAVATAESPIDHYIYEVGAYRVRLDYQDVIHFQYNNPKSMIYGQGSALAARTEIVADLFAAIWNKNFFKNSTRPDAILEVDKTLDDNIYKRTMEQWKRMHTGVSNAHRMALLQDGVKYKQVQTSQKDMDFLNQRKMHMQSILSVFNVPPAFVGVLEYANYANMKEQTTLFWNIMVAKIRQTEELLTMRAEQITFRPNVIIRANLENVKALKPDYEMISKVVQNFVNAGVPINDVIRVMQLPFNPVEGGDQPRSMGFFAEPQDQEDSEEKNDKNKAIKAVKIKAKGSDDEVRILKRQMNWKAFDRDIRDREVKMAAGMRGFFKAQRRRVIANAKRHLDEILSRQGIKAASVQIELFFEEGKEQKLMEGVVAKPIRRAYFDYAQKKGKQVDPEFNFSLTDPFANAWVENKKTKIVRELNAFTKEEISEAIVEQIEEALAEGISKSETIDQIVDRIDEIYDFAVEHRAERIARTEIISATNAGGHEGMKQAGAEKKEWLATNDEKTRESHSRLDGEVVGMNDSFITITGDSLKFPGDPAGDPSEIINCRCTLIPVVDE